MLIFRHLLAFITWSGFSAKYKSHKLLPLKFRSKPLKTPSAVSYEELSGVDCTCMISYENGPLKWFIYLAIIRIYTSSGWRSVVRVWRINLMNMIIYNYRSISWIKPSPLPTQQLFSQNSISPDANFPYGYLSMFYLPEMQFPREPICRIAIFPKTA